MDCLHRAGARLSKASALALTYGVALSGTMTITTILLSIVMRAAVGLELVEGGADHPGLSGSGPGVRGRQHAQGPQRRLAAAGGGALVYLLMSTWKKGRVRLTGIVQENTLPMDLFLDDIARRQPYRVPGRRCS